MGVKKNRLSVTKISPKKQLPKTTNHDHVPQIFPENDQYWHWSLVADPPPYIHPEANIMSVQGKNPDFSQFSAITY